MSEEKSNYGSETIEQEIQRKGLNAPRIARADLEANIVDTEIVEWHTKSGQILRWAVLTTRSGFAVVGDPSCAVSRENDDYEVGKRVAIENSKARLWPLMGYALKQQVHDQGQR